MSFSDSDFPNLPMNSVIPTYVEGESENLLSIYVDSVEADRYPCEYHFLSGLVAISLACGNNVQLVDLMGNSPIKANVFAIYTGQTCTGKTNSLKHLYRLINLFELALPDLPGNSSKQQKGSTNVGNPSSSACLVNNFDAESPVKGLVDYHHFRELLMYDWRSGGKLTKKLHEFATGQSTVISPRPVKSDRVAKDAFVSLTATCSYLSEEDAEKVYSEFWGNLYWAGANLDVKSRYTFSGKHVEVARAVAPMLAIDTWAQTFKSGELITWEPEAEKLMLEYLESILLPLKSESVIFGSIDKLAQKTSLLLAADLRSKRITEEISTRSILVTDYFIKCAKIVADQLWV